MVAEPGASETAATGGGAGVFTVTVPVPVTPSLVAVITAEPGASPWTRPSDDTVAIAGALVDHVIDRPVRTLPFASLSVAASCTDLPASMVADAGVTPTD